MKCIVVIPTYNERDNIARLVPQIVGFDFHVLIVDDNSPDGTGDLADQLACAHPYIHVIHRPAKQGLGTAYVRGFQYALGINRPMTIANRIAPTARATPSSKPNTRAVKTIASTLIAGPE